MALVLFCSYGDDLPTISNEVVGQLSKIYRDYQSRYHGKGVDGPPESPDIVDADDLIIRVPTAGILARSDTLIHGVMAPVWRLTGNIGSDDLTLVDANWETFVYNFGTNPAVSGEYLISTKLRQGVRYIIPALTLRGGCLAENHPGRGILFNIHIGTWSATLHKWVYDITTTVKAIDWRVAPYPDLGATGLFEARASAVYGIVWEVVPLDCSSPPGACGA